MTEADSGRQERPRSQRIPALDHERDGTESSGRDAPATSQGAAGFLSRFPPWFDPRDRPFLVVLTVLWSVYFLQRLAMHAAFGDWKTLWWSIFMTALGTGLTAGILRLMDPKSRPFTPATFFAVIGLCLLAGLIFTVANFRLIYWHVLMGEPWPTTPEWWVTKFYTLLFYSYFFIGVTASAIGALFYTRFFQEREKVLSLRNAANEARLNMLRYQLNPHFLFNSLNAVSSLIMTDDKSRAHDMIEQLSAFMRLAVYSDLHEMVPLADELQSLGHYLKIEQARLDDRLTVEIDVSEAAGRVPVPTLILQPAVENAIKHGVAPSERGGRVRIRARTLDGRMTLSVEDDGPGLSAEPVQDARRPGGVGLRNLQERLDVCYDGEAEFSIGSGELGGAKVTITVPIRPPAEESRR